MHYSCCNYRVFRQGVIWPWILDFEKSLEKVWRTDNNTNVELSLGQAFGAGTIEFRVVSSGACQLVVYSKV